MYKEMQPLKILFKTHIEVERFWNASFIDDRIYDLIYRKSLYSDLFTQALQDTQKDIHEQVNNGYSWVMDLRTKWSSMQCFCTIWISYNA